MTEETMVCPGECCWRGPKNPEEEKAFDKFWTDKWMAEQKLRQDCYVKSELAGEVNRNLPPPAEMAGALNGLIQGVAHESKNPRNQEEMANVIAGVNHALLGEAERLGMTNVPAMPDP